MRAATIAAALAGLLLAGPALADCSPPPPGMGKPQWYQLCAGVLWQSYVQTFGGPNDIVPFDVYVEATYRVYVDNSLGRPNGFYGPAPMAPCTSPGQTFCPVSGYVLTCNGSVWLTGAARC